MALFDLPAISRRAIPMRSQWLERFGSYPSGSLSIVPGMDNPAGGYPPAAELASVHGHHRLSERPEKFWRWITAHEIGHMYWSDSVRA